MSWISVEERLPELGEYVMVYSSRRIHNPIHFDFCKFTKYGFDVSNVTHWQPLPEPPK